MSFRLRRNVHRHREFALGNVAFTHQFREFFKGLTIAMSRTYGEIEIIRAQIIVSPPSLPEGQFTLIIVLKIGY